MAAILTMVAGVPVTGCSQGADTRPRIFHVSQTDFSARIVARFLQMSPAQISWRASIEFLPRYLLAGSCSM